MTSCSLANSNSINFKLLSKLLVLNLLQRVAKESNKTSKGAVLAFGESKVKSVVVKNLGGGDRGIWKISNGMTQMTLEKQRET